ncbi:MAG: DinB family protein [Acidobacteriota bacterium]|nr:DinB family protein [Acidobacteriota bacterium]
MTISETLLPEFDREMANTLKILDCVPEEKFTWKPHEKSMTLGRLASHVAEMPQWAMVTVTQDTLELTPEFKPFNAAGKSELIATFNANVAGGREALAGAGDDHLAKVWSLIYAGKPVLSMPRAAVLRTMVMSHMIHHRAQLSVYLRLLDVPIPGMYGPSADNL